MCWGHGYLACLIPPTTKVILAGGDFNPTHHQMNDLNHGKKKFAFAVDSQVITLVPTS